MSISTRAAGPADAAVVGRLLHDLLREHEGAVTPTAVELGGRFATLLARDDVHVVLTEQDNEAVGFTYLTLRPTPYHEGSLARLEALYVDPALRDRGVGADLLTTATRQVRAKGATEIQVVVDEVDADTRRFYERHEFVTVRPGTDHRVLSYVREL